MSTTAVIPVSSPSIGDADVLFSAERGQALPVVNLHFKDIRERRPYKTKRDGAFVTWYEIAGARTMNDAPGLKIIMDAMEKTYDGGKKWSAKWENTTARQIAVDIVTCGCGGAPTSAQDIRPAVWISEAEDCPRTAEQYAKFVEIYSDLKRLRNTFPKFAHEIEMYKRRQFAWCELQVREADQLDSNPRTAIDVGSKHRNAAAWILANPLEHRWMMQSQFGKHTECPFCGKGVPAGKSVCTSCNNIVDQSAFDAAKARVPGAKVEQPKPAA